MDVALKNMVLEAVDSAYIFALHNIFMGYMGSSTKYIMNHKIERYRRLISYDTKQKKKCPQKPLDTSQTSGVLFNIIDDGVRYSSEANTPLSPAQALQMAIHAVRSSEIYTYACKDLSRNLSADKTLANFKISFVLEYNKLRDEHHLNATQAGFQNAKLCIRRTTRFFFSTGQTGTISVLRQGYDFPVD